MIGSTVIHITAIGATDIQTAIHATAIETTAP
jgi:hypothetical protein